MQAKTVRFVWLLGVGSLSACLFSACNGDEDLVPAPETPAAGAGGESHGAGSAECEAIGRLCHEADTGSGTASECHSTGHEGEAAACNAIFESCIDTCVPAEGSEQGPYCRALGSYCHEADSGAGRGKECHDVGHAGDEEACAEEFDGCITFCRDALEQGGEGGSSGGHGNAGGEGGSHAHAAGGHAGADEHAAGGHGGEDEHAASGASGEHTGGHGGG